MKTTKKNKVIKRVYVAGKITGETRMNVLAKFASAEILLKEQGYEVINPLRVVNNWESTWQEAMRKCIKSLMDCDAIFLLPCVGHSKGARIELKLAMNLGLELIGHDFLLSKNKEDVLYNHVVRQNKDLSITTLNTRI